VKKPFGDSGSSIIFHILLGVPQYIALLAIYENGVEENHT
jgi:hypothetical protein